MRACIYVDGFNLYYSCLRDTPHRWLDLEVLSHAIVPDHEVRKVRYFTARVKRDHQMRELKRGRPSTYRRFAHGVS